jgi:hypothetical protein
MLVEKPPDGELPEEPLEAQKEEEGGEQPRLYDGPIEKFKGKPLEELEKAYQSIESEYDKTLSEAKRVKEENEAYKQWYQQQVYQQQQQQQYQQQQAPQQGESGQPDFYDKPYESFSQMYRQMRGRELVSEEIRDAQRNAALYEHMATTKYPNAFEGVNINDVRQVMVGGLSSGRVHPDVVRDPEMWANTAWTLKGRQSGYQFQQAPPSPAGPTYGETPSARKGDDSLPEATLSPEMKDIADMFLDGDRKKMQQLADETIQEEYDRREK